MIPPSESGAHHDMSFSETISPFFGRCAFVYFYLASAGDILGNWQAIAGQLDAKHPTIAYRDAFDRAAQL